MILYLYRSLGNIRRIVVPRWRRGLGVVLDEHTIEQDGEPRVLCLLTGCVKPGRMEDDVEGLPVAVRSSGIDDRSLLVIDGAAAVRFDFRPLLVGVKNLYFVGPVQKDPAVSTLRPLGRWGCGYPELQVKLTVAEVLLCLDVAALGLSITLLDRKSVV